MKSYKLYIGGNIYGAGNIGDDAVLEGIISILNQLNYDFSYTIGTYYGYKLDLSCPNIKYIDCYNDLTVTKAIKESDFVICGGGTLIGDELGLAFPLEFTATLIARAKLFDKKVFIFAIGANELKTKLGRRIVKNIFGLANVITLRDKESADVCKSIIKKKDIIPTADPSFILTPLETRRTKEIRKNFSSGNKFFGVNVVNEVWSSKKKYKKVIAEVCDYLNKKYDLIPVFFCNEVREGEFFDYEANKEAISYLSCKSEIIERIYYSPREMIDIISNFNFIIGMRMHTLIFAALTKTPFISISRIDKVDNFMKQFGLLSSYSVSKPNKNKLINDIEKIIENKSYYENAIEERLPVLKKAALKNKLIFDKTMNGKSSFLPRFNFMSLKYTGITSLTKNIVKRILIGK